MSCTVTNSSSANRGTVQSMRRRTVRGRYAVASAPRTSAMPAAGSAPASGRRASQTTNAPASPPRTRTGVVLRGTRPLPGTHPHVAEGMQVLEIGDLLPVLEHLRVETLDPGAHETAHEVEVE